jgi:adenylate cyclase class 2
MTNNREIEIKFKIDKPTAIRKILKNQKAKFIGRVFEKAIQFDTSSKNLKKHGKFLRVRSGFKNTLTFKRKIDNKKFKEREEIELEISEPEKMKEILEKLGFTKMLIMEKYREKWNLAGTEIDIDKLPFGTFIEIEGKPKLIQKTAKILGLDLKDGITATYWGLWRKFAKKKGIKDENITFKYGSKE